jgi:two-component system, sensor histidine kinase and response regulator
MNTKELPSTTDSPANAPAAIPDTPGTILVVDDEDVNIHLLQNVLTEQGHTIIAARDGAESLEKVKEHLPDLILMDVMMPCMDGLEACRILKSDPETCMIPIIILTALNQEDDYINAIDSNADDFMSKPFKQASLLARVRGYLRLKRLDEEVTRLAKLKEDLTHMIVHDLNGPMFGISGYLELLSYEDDLKDEVKDFVSKARRSADEARDMIRNLLQIEQIESGKLQVAPSKFILSELVNDAIHNAKPLIEVNGNTLVVEGPGTMNIFADRDLIKRVLQNLLANAIKFAPRESAIAIQYGSVGSQFMLAVENDGPTISKDDQTRIFDKFSQVNDRPSVARQGCGLGLNFCRLVAEAHNGSIQSISPRPDHDNGVRFEFCAPMNPPLEHHK